MSAAYLRSAPAIRERCHRLYQLGLAGRLPHFTIDVARLPAVADYVAAVTREAYPDLDIPIHGRMRHFDRPGLARLEDALGGLSPIEQARARVDLTVVSVLLDAGAGPDWRYVDETGATWARSEGLAVASLRMFLAGAFSSDPRRPLMADDQGLARVTREALVRGFHVRDDNPLVGVDGRLALLQGLGAASARLGGEHGRPGSLVDRLAHEPQIPAGRLLGLLLEAFGTIWPGRLTLDGVPLGDVWPHGALAPADAPLADRLVPFHKLSQWLAYSLVEPLAAGGLEVVRLDELTGLPEYRNGGLFLDLAVLAPRDPELTSRALSADSEPIVEWRALTVALLDELAPLVRERLGRSAEDLPLARILQGGTWTAGRRIAAERRAGGGPPLVLASDGTVF